MHRINKLKNDWIQIIRFYLTEYCRYITECGTLNQFDDSSDDDDDESDEFYKSKDDLGSPC